MLLRYAGAKASTVVFDFLAPSLIPYRAASSVSSRIKFTRDEFVPVPPIPSSSSEPEQVQAKIRSQISLLGSPSSSIPSDEEIDVFQTTVSQLRHALKTGDIEVVRSRWSSLHEKKLLQFLNSKQLDQCSRGIAKLCESGPSKGPWHPPHWTVIEEIGLVTACGGATAGLEACLLLHIKRNNPEDVIRLYGRYSQLSEGTKNLVETSAEESYADESNELAEPSETEIHFHDPSGAHLLLAAITAYAMLDSFEAALHLTLKESIRLRPGTMKIFSRYLNHDRDLQGKANHYVHILETARLVSHPSSLSKQISNLTNSQAVQSLEKHYRTIQAGLSDSYPWLAGTPEAVSSKRPVLMPLIGWTSFIVAFIKCRRMDLAGRLWDDMIACGVKPGVEVWTALLEGYGAIKAIEESVVTWNAMLKDGVTPDWIAFRTIITTLMTARRPEQAMGKFEKFLKSQDPETMDKSKELPVYNAVLHGLLINSPQDTGFEKRAHALFQKMKDDGPTPDTMSYNIFMHHYGRKGDMKSLAASLQSLTDAGLAGDEFTFATLLLALFKVGRKDAPTMVADTMRTQGLEPNVTMHTAIINHSLRERNESGLRAAFELLRWMEQQPKHIHPNEVTYTSFLTGMYRDDWLDSGLREECRQYVMDRMKDRKIKPNRVTYHILLKACLANSGPEGVQQALRYYREMVERKIRMAHDTWYVILRGIVKRGDWAMGDEMVNEIRRTGFVPVGGVLDMIQRIRRRKDRKT